MQLHSEACAGSEDDKHKLDPSSAADLIEHTLRNSSIPSLMEKAGPYAEPTEEVLESLNSEFCAHPSLLHAAAKLHTGAIVVDRHVILLLVAEAYGRSKTVDLHGEANMKSLPSPSTCIYKTLSVGIHKESDANGMKRS
ncbi:hypothetical protein BCR43DRAFT_512174 [Syncephalastrum racemosum]|uniref:Uncharacterized protein n=1 Tax=Syncephalastrum racemosum TaxID=13706 RepID=A0A1X2HPG5_SYNRA|nr:hypothetical protein BCR43DRAFT_512174 [Syncephalastrum racemosum]